MKKILYTGFEAFGGDKINPALQSLELLPKTIAGAHVHTLQVPVVHQKSIQIVLDTMDRIHPDVVILIGQAGGRFGLTPERVAINVDDYRIPDNENNQVVDKPVVDGAPAAYWSTLPIKKIVQTLRKNHIPAMISNTAGTFVCNHLFFGIMHALRDTPNVKAGFIHIPFALAQRLDATVSTMDVSTMVHGLQLAGEISLNHQHDDAIAMGTLD